MDVKDILKDFELEKGYDPITTSDCELTNWLIKKLIEARHEIGELHLNAVSNTVCVHDFGDRKQFSRCRKCGII